MLTRLQTIIVEKPWGRTDIPGDFGNFGGRRIGEIWFAHPAGDASPIMVKFLFSSERLSIQVHPDDAAARAAGYSRGKEECWLVLDAEPDAELGVGLAASTTREALRAAALDGSIVDMIDDHLENEFNQPEVYSRVFTFDKFISSIEYLPDDLLVNK